MLTTYEAVLRDNLIEWREDAPRHLAPGIAVHVHVTVLDDAVSSVVSQGHKMAAALEKLAQSGTFANMDATLWEREVRIERTLPGRSE